MSTGAQPALPVGQRGAQVGISERPAPCVSGARAVRALLACAGAVAALVVSLLPGLAAIPAVLAAVVNTGSLYT